MERFTWVGFYKELAVKLRAYRHNRPELVQKIQDAFEGARMNMPTLDEGGEVTDLDPFTIYATFNKNQTEANRLKIATEFKKVFGIEAELPRDFDGVPRVNAMNATYYQFRGKRDEGDIDGLWDLFEAAMEYAHEQSWENREKLMPLFDFGINLKYNGLGKITMGLFWMAPDVFLNLDRQNKYYIYQSGALPEEFVRVLPYITDENCNAETYFEILDKMTEYVKEQGWGDFVGFSKAAWDYAGRMSESGDGGTDDGNRVRYWVYSPGENAKKWEQFYNEGVMGIGWGEIGDLRQFSEMAEISEAVRERYAKEGKLSNIRFGLWQFVHVLKPGDVVFVKKGRTEIVGRGVVESDYYYDENEPSDYKNKRKVNWTHKGDWGQELKMPSKTLTDISDYNEYVEGLSGLFEGIDEDPPEDEATKEVEPYDFEQFLSEVYAVDAEYLETILDWLRVEKNIILQGAPGVGKTFVAKRLAYAAMGAKDKGRVCLVQFHQSYSYEDFIEGFRPANSGNGFEIKKGTFYKFCDKAKQDPDNDYFFIIDEINRGNLSKIFGELFMLIEKDKRNASVRLLYSDENFRVPENVYIIGTMNTADRSLALLDYALRRRFVFFDLQPAFDSDGFKEYQRELASEAFDRLVKSVEEVNKMIEDDSSLGKGFRIGHSYLTGLRKADSRTLMGIVEHQLLPLLEEYWFDNRQNYDAASIMLRDAIL